MSLDWDTSNVANAAEVCIDPETGRQSGTTRAIAGASYLIGLWDLRTESEVDRWWLRISFTQTLQPGRGFALPYSGEPAVILTREDLVRHVGMSTNCFPAITDADFLKRALAMFADAHGIKAEPVTQRQ